MKLLFGLLSLLGASSSFAQVDPPTPKPPVASPWLPVIQAIEEFNIPDMAVAVVNGSGVQFLYEKGNISYFNQVMSK